jgi:hypothetical protein
VVNVYPLSKCYDKSAKVKLAVDFIPVSEKRESREQAMSGNKMTNQVNQVSFKQSTTIRREELTGSNAGSVGGNMGNIGNTGNTGGFYKNPTGIIKSRLAEE